MNQGLVHQNKHIRMPFAATINYTHLTYLMLWSNAAAKETDMSDEFKYQRTPPVLHPNNPRP